MTQAENLPPCTPLLLSIIAIFVEWQRFIQ
jgi:hypothetical protein